MVKMRKKMLLVVSGLLLLCAIYAISGQTAQSKVIAEPTYQQLLGTEEIVTDIDATYSFTRLNDTECDVRITNRTEATRAILPQTAEIEGTKYKVVEIALNGFMSATKLRRVALPPTIHKIDNMAFANCTALEKITLSNVVEIGDNAFLMCRNISEIVIPNSVQKMGNSVFRNTNTKIRLRASEIGGDWVTTWNLGNENQDVEFNSTYLEPTILEPIYQTTARATSPSLIGFSLASGQPYTEDFYGDKIIHFPAVDPETGLPILKIDDFALWDNNFSQLIIDYSENVLFLGQGSFFATIGDNIVINRPIDYEYGINTDNIFSCSTVKSIVLPDNIPGITKAMFAQCSNLENIYFISPKDRIDQENIIEEQNPTRVVTLPKSATYIGELAFAECFNINKLIIPNNIDIVESKIFDQWIESQKVEIDFDKEHLPANWNKEFTSGSKCTIDFLWKTLYLDACGGIIEGNNYIIVKKGVAIGEMPLVFLNNATFDGWYTQQMGEGIEFTEKTIYIDENVNTLYAKWNVTITFDSDGGSTVSNEIIVRGKTITLPTPTLNGATFAGWYTSKDGEGTRYTSSTVINANIKLYAKWNVTITFDSDGGSLISNETIVRGKTITLPTPTLSGATFAGWYTSKDGEGIQYTSSTVINANIKLYAKWNVTIAFISEGISISNKTIIRGKTTIMPTPTLSGATFAGWYTSKDGEGIQYTSSTAINSNIKLYAKWTVMITFNSDGGSSVNNKTIVKGKTTTLPTPTLNGATFAGWYTKKAGDGDKYTNSDPITKNITLYAKWNVTISFRSSGGSNCESITGVIGKSILLPTPTFGSREGYWEYDKDNSNYNFGTTFKINGTSNSFTAIWERYITFVQINGNGTANPSQITLIKGNYWPTISIPARRGYTNKGYYSDSNNQGTQYYNVAGQPIQMQFDLNNDLTLYLTWDAEPYYIVIEYMNILDSDARFVYSIRAEFEKEYEYTAEKSIMSQSGMNKNFSRWSIIRGTQNDFHIDTNEWIVIAEGDENRTIKFSVKDFVAKYYPDLRSYETITLRAFYDGSCVAEGSLITLADGSQKAVEELTGDEKLLVWNFLTGKFDTAPILFIDSDAASNYEVINLYFSDGTNVKVMTEHAFWDFNLNKYVYLRTDASKYIGHWFNKQIMSEAGELVWTRVQLIDVVVKSEYTSAWSPVTYGYMGYYVNGLLSIPGDGESFINYFDVVGDTMQYDLDAMQADIDTYGLYTYEEFAELVPVSEEIFNAFNGQFLKISIGKGLTTIERIKELVALYGKYL